MPNIVNPDCGWNDSLRLAFVETTNDAIQDPDGYDVQFLEMHTLLLQKT